MDERKVYKSSITISNSIIKERKEVNNRLSEVGIFSVYEFSLWNYIQNVEEFRKNVKYVRAYHGCRPINFNEYLVKGLIVPSKERLSDLTYRLLGDFVKKEELDRVISVSWENYIAKGTYFVLDKELLINECGHYVIYGSEFICSIAGQFWCQSELKKQGIPTIICVDVPVEMISDETIQELIRGIQGAFCDDIIVNFGFRITQNISPEQYIYFEYPKRIIDPLNGFMPYHVD